MKAAWGAAHPRSACQVSLRRDRKGNIYLESKTPDSDQAFRLNIKSSDTGSCSTPLPSLVSLISAFHRYSKTRFLYKNISSSGL